MRVTLNSLTLGCPRLNLTGVCFFFFIIYILLTTRNAKIFCLCDIYKHFLPHPPELNLMDILTTPSLVKPKEDYFRTPGQVLSLISSLGLVSRFAESFHLYITWLKNIFFFCCPWWFCYLILLALIWLINIADWLSNIYFSSKFSSLKNFNKRAIM